MILISSLRLEEKKQKNDRSLPLFLYEILKATNALGAILF